MAMGGPGTAGAAGGAGFLPSRSKRLPAARAMSQLVAISALPALDFAVIYAIQDDGTEAGEKQPQAGQRALRDRAGPSPHHQGSDQKDVSEAYPLGLDVGLEQSGPASHALTISSWRRSFQGMAVCRSEGLSLSHRQLTQVGDNISIILIP